MSRGASFDVERFYAALDETRSSRGLQWRQVAEEAGVAASLFSRMAQGKRPDLDGFAALVQWAALDANEFLGRVTPSKNTVRAIGSLLRTDSALSVESAAAILKVVRTLYDLLRNRRSI